MDFSFESLTFHTSPNTPPPIKMTSVTRFMVFKTLKERFEFAISTRSLTKTRIYIGTNALKYKSRFLKNHVEEVYRTIDILNMKGKNGHER